MTAIRKVNTLLLRNCLKTVKQFTNSARKLSVSKQLDAVVLGIETSCDETGVAIVDNNKNLLGEGLNSQHDKHLSYGGVIPIVARDLHRKSITDVCEKALRDANLRLRDIDAIAVTVKPGLPLALRVGRDFAQYLSKISNKPVIPIHHMQAHALTARMDQEVEFPFLVLLVSGGHCLLAIAESVNKFYLLGTHKDNAPGECLDKVARRLRLRFVDEFSNLSGGRAIELAATKATDIDMYKLTVPMLHERSCQFSFASVKTSTKRIIQYEESLYNLTSTQVIPNAFNLCASIQYMIAEHLCHRTKRAMEFMDEHYSRPEQKKTLVFSGGVACNNFYRNALETLCLSMDYKFIKPPQKLCTDNGIMIAWNGMEKYLANVDVMRDPKEIENIEIEGKCLIGEDWTEKVVDANIKCQLFNLRKEWQKLEENEVKQYSVL